MSDQDELTKLLASLESSDDSEHGGPDKKIKKEVEKDEVKIAKPLPKITPISTVETMMAKNNIGQEAAEGAAKKFGQLTEELMDNYRSDREEIQEVIDHLKNKVYSDPKPKSYFVEGLVTSIKVKSDTNANFIKMLDSFVKLVSTGKSELFAKKVDFGTSDLAKLLQDGE